MPQGNALNLPPAALVPSKIIVRIGNVKIPLKDCSRASVAELQAGEILPCVAAAATDLDVCVPHERAKLVRAEPFSIKLEAVDWLSAFVVRVSAQMPEWRR